MENVEAELRERGIEQEAIEKLKPILLLEGTTAEKLATLRSALAQSETGLKGVEEMEELFGLIDDYGTELEIELDLSLARGLNYYTGAIFEVKAKDFQIGSICGGGRYDDLTGIFGLPNTSGVGISFGADRIYDVMLGLGLFPEEAQMTTKVLFINFGGEEQKSAMGLLKALRAEGVSSDIYPEAAKMKKQMEYANKRAIPYVVIVGESERIEGVATVKNMVEGEQVKVPFGELAKWF
jgi:histidyl-tRNA synthetase